MNKSGAGCLILCPKTERVLLNLRAANKSHNLKWGLWGGMIEQDENPKDTVLRELEEEAGFLPEISRFYPFDVYQSRDNNFIFYTFVCVVEDEFVPVLNEESDGYAWINLGVWPKPMHHGAKISFCHNKGLKKLNLILKQHI